MKNLHRNHIRTCDNFCCMRKIGVAWNIQWIGTVGTTRALAFIGTPCILTNALAWILLIMLSTLVDICIV